MMQLQQYLNIHKVEQENVFGQYRDTKKNKETVCTKHNKLL